MPEMTGVRPLVVNKEGTILGGNQRYEAMCRLGWKEVPIIRVNWSKKKQREFIIKDNVSQGHWDWEELELNWSADELEQWGVQIAKWDTEHDMDDMFEQHTPDQHLPKHTIVLTFDDELQYNKLKEKLEAMEGAKEDIIYQVVMDAE